MTEYSSTKISTQSASGVTPVQAGVQGFRCKSWDPSCLGMMSGSGRYFGHPIPRSCAKGLLSLRCIGLWLTFGTLLIIASACMVGPNYKRPDSDVPSKWNEMPESVVNQTSENLGRWWTTFSDPQLDSLIERAILFNKDLKV
ncbi:MAG: hypothetical protein HGA74_17090, partial [Deltaproteobacteria bacterium]|nr:hypothetical protein [Deltaproteobacteria bacterium]